MIKIKGFTLAEILIALTIIGVVAAITIPALMQNVTEKQWDAKRKALLTRMSMAVGQMDKISGYGTYTTNSSGEVTADTLTESFLIEGLSKVYRIKNICDSKHIAKCGMPSSVFNVWSQSKAIPTDMKKLFDTNTNYVKNAAAAAFETENGEKIVAYYNPDCKPTYPHLTTRTVKDAICAHFIFDLNGADGPNMINKDVGIMSIIYGTEATPHVVSPNFILTNAKAPFYAADNSDAASVCKSKGENYTLPSIDEALSIVMTPTLSVSNNANAYSGFNIVSGTPYSAGSSGKVWVARYSTDSATPNISLVNKTDSTSVVCVKE